MDKGVHGEKDDSQTRGVTGKERKGVMGGYGERRWEPTKGTNDFQRKFNKLTSDFQSSVIDHEFRQISCGSKVAVDPRGNSREDPQTILTMLSRNSLSITGQTHENWLPFVFYDNKLSNWPLSLVVASQKITNSCVCPLLTVKISQWVREISAVIVKTSSLF